MTLTKKFLESGRTVASWTGPHRLLGALAGIPIIENRALPYDRMYVGTGIQGIVVGEQRHFLWRMRCLDEDQACRDAAAQHIKNVAERILGEKWELSSR